MRRRAAPRARQARLPIPGPRHPALTLSPRVPFSPFGPCGDEANGSSETEPEPPLSGAPRPLGLALSEDVGPKGPAGSWGWRVGRAENPLWQSGRPTHVAWSWGPPDPMGTLRYMEGGSSPPGVATARCHPAALGATHLGSSCALSAGEAGQPGSSVCSDFSLQRTRGVSDQPQRWGPARPEFPGAVGSPHGWLGKHRGGRGGAGAEDTTAELGWEGRGTVGGRCRAWSSAWGTLLPQPGLLTTSDSPNPRTCSTYLGPCWPHGSRIPLK